VTSGSLDRSRDSKPHNNTGITQVAVSLRRMQRDRLYQKQHLPSEKNDFLCSCKTPLK